MYVTKCGYSLLGVEFSKQTLAHSMRPLSNLLYFLSVFGCNKQLSKVKFPKKGGD